jgi:hypothetical protein
MGELHHRNTIAARLGTTVKQAGIQCVEVSPLDGTGCEIRWGQWPIFSQVRRKDVRLLKALVALRVQTLCKKNSLAARTLPLA